MLFVIHSSPKFSAKYPLQGPRQRLTKQGRDLRRIRFTPGSSTGDRRGVGNNFNSRPDHAGIARSLDYMARHWRRPIQVPDLARAAGLSRRGYMKAFLKHTGGTPARRVRAMRLEHARRMLLGGDDRLEIIARQSGFRSVNSFIIAFKRETGVAPMRFRQDYRARRKIESAFAPFEARRISNHLCRNLNGNL